VGIVVCPCLFQVDRVKEMAAPIRQSEPRPGFAQVGEQSRERGDGPGRARADGRADGRVVGQEIEPGATIDLAGRGQLFL